MGSSVRGLRCLASSSMIRRDFAEQFNFRLIVSVDNRDMVIDTDNSPVSAFVPCFRVVFDGVKPNGDDYISLSLRACRPAGSGISRDCPHNS